MGYEYDVFVSYSHDYPFGSWVNDPFLPLFQGLLKAALGQQPKIFTDHQIRSGETWENRIGKALAQSKCLVGIWSPNYFLSKWCNLECFFMLHRQKISGYGTFENPGGLIIPVSLHDGEEHFPQFAKDIQYREWEQFALTGEGFKKTAPYADFQTDMFQWTRDVAAAIKNAPPWDDEWGQEHWIKYRFPEWLKNPGINLANKNNTFKAPSLA